MADSDQMGNAEILAKERFPRSANYDTKWMISNSMGPNAIWITEFLSTAMSLKPGMKVLDLGCGKAMTSIFLAREFDVEVWANDLWIPAAENEERIRQAGLADQIHAVHVKPTPSHMKEGSLTPSSAWTPITTSARMTST